MGVLTQRTRDKLSTPRWKSLRDLFLQVGEAILEVSPDAQGDLAGTYVKFTNILRCDRHSFSLRHLADFLCQIHAGKQTVGPLPDYGIFLKCCHKLVANC